MFPDGRLEDGVGEVLTQSRLKELLHYDRGLGWFMWQTGYRAGTAAGSLNKILGYVLICIDGVDYYAHRLAHLYVEGSFPEVESDHRDRDRSNNRWRNLRRASHKQNQENQGATGVYQVPSGNWVAKIKHNRQSHYLGTFTSRRAAVTARRTAEDELFTHHAR